MKNNSLKPRLYDYIKYEIGSFSFLYKDGFVRKISYGEIEILRGVYPAVRDHNWGTVPLKVLKSNFISMQDGIKLIEEVEFREYHINYHATLVIQFTQQGLFEYSFKGMSNSDFLKNRIGLNVLLPIEKTAGKPYWVEHSDGIEKEGHFPNEVMPQQPIKDIISLKWRNEVEILIEFKGDIFEMEDQRNWTDSSFKIYSTPLELPFPVTIEKGHETIQSINLKLICNNNKSLVKKTPTADVYREFHLPKIGICIYEANLWKSNYNLQNIKFDFIHQIINQDDVNWLILLKDTIDLATSLNIKIKLSVILCERPHKNIFSLISLMEINIQIFWSIEIYQNKTFLSKGKNVETLTESMKKIYPSLKVGGGTYAYYAEVNRTSLINYQFDYFNFSVSPQVHAFDKLSIVENIKGLEYVAKDAVRKYKSSIHIGPISLKQRMNFVKTEKETETKGKKQETFDQRQHEVFGALWILGCVKTAAISSIEEISFFVPLPESNYKLFPFYQILLEVLKYKTSKVSVLEIQLPDIVDGFFLNKELWIWNYSDITVEINGDLMSENVLRFNFTKSLWEHIDDKNILLPESIYRFLTVKD